jgi:hypothetical protein
MDNQNFGTRRDAFSLKQIKQLLNDGQNNNFKAARKYFTCYYAKSLSNGYYFFDPIGKTDRSISNMDEQQMSQVFKQIPVKQYTDLNGNKASFDLKKWFTQVWDSQYSIGFDPLEGMFYECKDTKKTYINMARTFIHQNPKKYSKYPKDIQAKVERILTHLKKVWNSDNEECYQYTLNHLANACTRRKMNTCVFLKSGEGTGKSIILEFIINHVIGEHLGLITGRASQLAGFNYQLLGKLIVVLEELPTESKGQWFQISDIIKQLITGTKLEVEKKHADMITVANYISLYILTNNDNTIKFGKDMRRYFMADISHDHVGDTEYYTKLAEACSDRSVGEAMFAYFKDVVKNNPNFDETKIPFSDSKLSMKSQNITPILSFIKEKYLQKRKGLEADTTFGLIPLKNFHEEVQLYSVGVKTVDRIRSTSQEPLGYSKANQSRPKHTSFERGFAELSTDIRCDRIEFLYPPGHIGKDCRS